MSFLKYPFVFGFKPFRFSTVAKTYVAGSKETVSKETWSRQDQIWPQSFLSLFHQLDLHFSRNSWKIGFQRNCQLSTAVVCFDFFKFRTTMNSRSHLFVFSLFSWTLAKSTYEEVIQIKDSSLFNLNNSKISYFEKFRNLITMSIESTSLVRPYCYHCWLGWWANEEPPFLCSNFDAFQKAPPAIFMTLKLRKVRSGYSAEMIHGFRLLFWVSRFFSLSPSGHYSSNNFFPSSHPPYFFSYQGRFSKKKYFENKAKPNLFF